MIMVTDPEALILLQTPDPNPEATKANMSELNPSLQPAMS